MATARRSAGKSTGKDRPGVPTQHVVARQATTIVRASLPPEWTIDEFSQGNDYGVDLHIQIARRGEMTSERVSLQVKGTSNSAPRSVRVARATLLRLCGMSDLSAIVVVSVARENVWLIPVRDHRVQVALASEAAVPSIPLQQFDHVDGDLAAKLDILSHRVWTRARASEGHPVVIAAVGWDDNAAGALVALSAHLPSWIFIERTPACPRHQIQAELHFGVHPFVRDRARPSRPLSISAPPVAPLEHLALTLAVGLVDIGLVHAGVAILERVLPHVEHGRFPGAHLSVLSSEYVRLHPGVTVGRPESAARVLDLYELVNLIRRERGLGGAFDVVRQAHCNGATWCADVISVMNVQEPMPSGVLDLVRDMFRRARSVADDDRLIAQSHMNEVYLLKRANRFDLALLALIAAARAHPDYPRLGHFWCELGGVLYNLNRRDLSARSYILGMQLSPGAPRALGLAMHACVSVGRWADALRMWEQHPDQRNAFGFLGATVAAWWSKRHTPIPDGTEKVRAVWQASLEAHVGGDDTVQRVQELASIIHLNPIDAGAALAASIGFHSMGETLAAYHCALTSAYLFTGDSQCWRIAFKTYWLLSTGHSPFSGPLFVAMVDTCAEMLGGQVFQELALEAPDAARPVLARLAMDLRAAQPALEQHEVRPIALSARPRGRIPYEEPTYSNEIAEKLLQEWEDIVAAGGAAQQGVAADTAPDTARPEPRS